MFGVDACNPALSCFNLIPLSSAECLGLSPALKSSWVSKRMAGWIIIIRDNCVFSYRQQNDSSFTWGKKKNAPSELLKLLMHCLVPPSVIMRSQSGRGSSSDEIFVPLTEHLLLKQQFIAYRKSQAEGKNTTEGMCGDACIDCDDAGEMVRAKWLAVMYSVLKTTQIPSYTPAHFVFHQLLDTY